MPVRPSLEKEKIEQLLNRPYPGDLFIARSVRLGVGHKQPQIALVHFLVYYVGS
jgi:hypothetical protein